MRKALAGAVGLTAGLASYAVLGIVTPTPGPLAHAVPMHESAVKVATGPINFVDPRPVRLAIPAIGVNAVIEARGLDSNRNMDVPKDYHDVAWYSLGPRPGEPGNALINGHSSWWSGDAVFTGLSRLRAGDEVRVVRADGVVVTFKVTSSKTVGANERIASLFAPSTVSTLTLITCSGPWSPITRSTPERLLVSAAHA